MKVLLLNPPSVGNIKMVREGRCMQREAAWTAIWPPISLTTTAALLEREGIQTQIVDAVVEEVDFYALRQLLKKTKPDLLVINTATPSIMSDLETSKLAKKINPEIKTLAFGIHVSALPKETMKEASFLDFLAIGEPELTILELALKLEKKNLWNNIKGLVWRSGKRIIINGKRLPEKNLNDWPYPAWNKINLNKYLLPFSNNPFLLVDTGRGCPYQCRFCAAKVYYGAVARFPTAKRIVDEIEDNQNKYGVSDFLFWSESFTLNRQNSLDVCQEIIKRQLKVNWVCNSRVDTVDLQQLKLFKKAGCWMIGFGFESGNERILNLMKKKINLKQIKEAVKMAKIAGLQVTGHLMIGYPGEDEKTIKETIKMAIDLDLDYAQFYTLVPFPGSEIYAETLKNGYLNTMDWSRYEQNFGVVTTPWLKGSEVEKLRSIAYRQFYFRPKMIIKTLKRLKTPKEWWNLLKMTNDFQNWI
jgi:anaerobic magnesium-protoporphyrin IX monomethyl ester cyclase